MPWKSGRTAEKTCHARAEAECRTQDWSLLLGPRLIMMPVGASGPVLLEHVPRNRDRFRLRALDHSPGTGR